MNRLTIAVATGLLACACSHHESAVPTKPIASQPVVEQKPSIDLSTVEITVSRTECLGWCPNYEVTIKGTGEVHYVGRSFVKGKGERTGKISPDAVRGLLAQFNDAGFLRLDKDYSQTVTDCPATILSLKVEAQANRVRNYWLPGEHVDPWGEEVQDWRIHEALDALANAVDGAVNIDKWIGTEKERRAEYEQSHERGNPGSTSTR